MSAPETSKRESNKGSSFLGTKASNEIAHTYLEDKSESSALESVYDYLFSRVIEAQKNDDT